uniref:Protein TsetseEP domain-containing protein n=1 Tax=Stomoxys calcitrans TaxID=35570 RepID=A0A1I8NWA0_STOCA
MKTIFAIFALCLVAANAGAIDNAAINYEGMVDDVLAEMGQIAKDAAVALQHGVEEIVMDPLHQVEEAVENIEARRPESEECVAAQDEKVAATVDTMHQDMGVCGVIAAKTSAEIMSDISAATQQLVFGGYDVVSTYRRCQRYTNSVLKNSCYARLTIKATLYMTNARKSIKTIRKSTNERIPAAIADADACTHTAAEVAIHELDNVHATIDSCIAKY